MKIIGLDCATKTGYAIIKDGLVTKCGVVDFSKKYGESNGHLFLKFSRWLQDFLLYNVDSQEEKETSIYYEQAHHRGRAATEICIGLTTRVQEICTKHKFDYAPVHSGTLKKFATGFGKSKKDSMIKLANEITSNKFDIDDDNVADAVWISLYGWNEIGIK